MMRIQLQNSRSINYAPFGPVYVGMWSQIASRNNTSFCSFHDLVVNSGSFVQEDFTILHHRHYNLAKLI